MPPLFILDLEELRQHWPCVAPGARVEPGDLSQHSVIVGEGSAAPEVKNQQEVGAVLFGGEVHGIGEVIADINRHPEVRRAQSLWMVVLCP